MSSTKLSDALFIHIVKHHLNKFKHKQTVDLIPKIKKSKDATKNMANNRKEKDKI